MRATIVVAYVFVFSLSILTGYWLSLRLLPDLYPVPQADTAYPVPGGTNTEQINLLVFFVNKIDETPTELQMVWMVAFNPGTPIKFIPVYPSSTQDSAKDSELTSNPIIKRHDNRFILDQVITQILRERGLEWDGIIILDNRALAYIIDTFGSIRVSGENLDREQLAAYKFPEIETKQSNLTYQTLLWREICWNILHSPEDIPNLNKDFNKHSSISLSEEISNQDWVTLLANVKIPSCEFPMYFQNNP
jgi:hypothetical protein